MKYIVAPIISAESFIQANLLQARRKSVTGKVLLNENDLKNIPGTLEEKVIQIEGVIINESEAIEETNKQEWL